MRARAALLAAALRARRVRRRRRAPCSRSTAARQGSARVLRAGIREGASRRRRAVGGHGLAGRARPPAQRGGESAGRRVVRRAGGDVRARGGRGLLAPYKPTWADAVPPEARDAHDLWYGTYLTPEVIAYNSEAVSAADAPQGLGRRARSEMEGEGAHPRSAARAGACARSSRADRARVDARTGPGLRVRVAAKLDASTKEYALESRRCCTRSSGGEEGLITLYDMPDIATLRSASEHPGELRDPEERHADARRCDRDREGREAPDAGEAVLRIRHHAGGVPGGGEKFCAFRRGPTSRSIRSRSGCARRRRSIKPMPMDRALLATASRRVDEVLGREHPEQRAAAS